ncbi:hypothetical protein [Undibacterium oligocarboniphilum]|uniref:Uncharacterized protein n=1 Tax=Undibacterium oligocarboniphilum TaxID=666702 RepID=A0A850QS95_9BURK|nr:hypothetical protein [Undibacterium oligocarboniphilum]MBC3871508.1 hypothetical protein [Undibacterium oligocarboniphilum]NVO78916.1 hypothetical protein [Undibacterium oligocarboniphilum]
MALELTLNYSSLKQALALRGYVHPVGIQLTAAKIQHETGWSLPEYIQLMMKENLCCQQMADELQVDSKTLRKFAQSIDLEIPKSKPVPRQFENIVAALRSRARHRADLRWIEHNGERLCVAQWATLTGIPAETIKKRLALGWSASEALTLAVGKRRLHPNRSKPVSKPAAGHPWRATMNCNSQPEIHCTDQAPKQT